MNILDELLKADAAKATERETKKYEVKRLSKKLGFKFELTLQALSPERLASISEDSIIFDKKGKKVDKIDIFNTQATMLIEGIQEPSLKNKDLLKHFGAATPNILINKLFSAGEVNEISDEISTLSGVKSQQEVDEEIKN